MKDSSQLVQRVEEYWEHFSSAWKAAGHGPDVKRVHDLRVATRRLVASLDLLRAVIDDDRIVRLRRRLKKIEKRLGPLRDAQVHLLQLHTHGPPESLMPLQRSLKRTERKETEKTLHYLRGQLRKKNRRLLSGIERTARRALESAFPAEVDNSVRSVIRASCDELATARARISMSDPASLHALRVAARRLRYLLESGAAVIGGAPAEQLELLRNYQSSLGDNRDLQLLENEIRQMSKATTNESEMSEIARYCRALSRRRTSRLKAFSALPPIDIEFQRNDRREFGEGVKPTEG